MARLLTDGIARSSRPAVAVVHGRAGTGRTSFVVGLVAKLADKKFIPVAVFADDDGRFDLDRARRAFCATVDDVLDTDEQVNAIWHRAKATREMVVLVDGLDDEKIDSMWRDGGVRLARDIDSLQSKNIAVVLATTRELPLKEGIPALLLDLDLFSREEAKAFIEEEIRGPARGEDDLAEARIQEAFGAVNRLPDLVGEPIIAPFYLDVLLRLQKNGIPLGELPTQTDEWRAAVLQKYLDHIEKGEIALGDPALAGSALVDRSRGPEARIAAETVAQKLPLERTDLMVPEHELEEVAPRALGDAKRLNLLWFAERRVGFALDDLGSYLVATAQDEPKELIDALGRIASAPGSGRRSDRHVLHSLIFWHLRHGGEARAAAFRDVLATLETCCCTRPSVVAAAIRIAGICRLEEFDEPVEKLATQCIDRFADGRAEDAGERLGVVRALAGWHTEEAHKLLWRLATSRDIEVEWPAAKALAISTSGPETTLRPNIDELLAKAEREDLRRMSRPNDDLGNRLASLAWILPALRGSDDRVEEQLTTVTRLCLDEEMSPLRGAMSLAQGLKLAIVNERASEANLTHACNLLGTGSIRSWHARLVLVQALLAGAWSRGDGWSDRVTDQLKAVRASESHEFVRRGIDLARDGLKKVNKRSVRGKTPVLAEYMWTHERDAVRWVELGRHRVTQLAADVVLLSNMIYHQRKTDPIRADGAACAAELPRCFHDSGQRLRIGECCNCTRKLCGRTDTPAVSATRARFAESFCRDQARVVAEHGPPPWTKPVFIPYRRSRRRIKTFWEAQAKIAQADRR